MYDNWLFRTLLLFPLTKKREEEKKNEVAKPVFHDPSILIILKFEAIITY